MCYLMRASSITERLRDRGPEPAICVRRARERRCRRVDGHAPEVLVGENASAGGRVCSRRIGAAISQ